MMYVNRNIIINIQYVVVCMVQNVINQLKLFKYERFN